MSLKHPPSLKILDNDYVKEAIEFLQKNCPSEGYYLCFSGGKDSIVSKHLLILAGVPFSSGYAFPGIDPPEIVQYIRKHHPDVEIISSGSFFKNVEKKGPTTIFRRWCCDHHKKKPQSKIENKHMVQGIRAEESTKRAKRKRINSFRKEIHYYPIFYWKEWQVWEFIEKYNLPYCKLYDNPKIHRIGCCICPFMGDTARRASQIKYPGYWKAYKNAIKSYWNRKLKNKPEIQYEYKNFEEFWNWIGIKGEWKPSPKDISKGLNIFNKPKYKRKRIL